MDEIRDVIGNLLTRRANRIEVLEEGQGDTLYSKFFEGVKGGDFTDDDSAAKALYGTTAQDSRYKVLKTRFKERLMNTMLFITPRNSGEARSASQEIFKCYRQFIIAKLLLAGGAQMAGKANMRTAMTKARGLQQWDLVMLASLTLRRLVGKEGNSVEYAHIDLIYQDSLSKLLAETESEKIQTDVEILLAKKVGKNEFIDEQVRIGYERINQLSAAHPTTTILFKQFMLTIAYLGNINQQEKAYELGEEYLKSFLADERYYTKTRHANIMMQMLDCTLQLRDYHRALQIAHSIKRLYREGTANWFTLQELVFLTSLNTGRLKEAAQLYDLVIRHPDFGRLKMSKQEIWKLFGGYLWFDLRTANQADLAERIYGSNSRFSMNRLLNETQEISADKQGVNVAIVVLRVLYLLDRAEFGELVDYTGAVRRYLYKYLSVNRSPRSYYFVKMILAIDKYGFDAKVIESRTRKILEKMSEVNVQLNTTETRMEIVPYEEIWDKMLLMLKKPVS